jgi:hypothetical protein
MGKDKRTDLLVCTGVDRHIRTMVESGAFGALGCAQCSRKITRDDVLRRKVNMSSTTFEA